MCVAQAATHTAVPYTTKNRTYTRAATICIHYSPWFYVFPKGARPTEFPEKAAAEVALWARNLKKIATWLADANAAAGANVTISAVLLDSERFHPSKANETESAAVDERHNAVYNASKAQFPEARVEYYDRGGFQLDGVGTGAFIGDSWFSHNELGDSYSLPMYSVGDLGYSRQAFALTAAAATAANVSDVTPWVLLGGGVVPNLQLQTFRFFWEYPLMNSWQIGRDINQPCPFAARLGGLSRARVAVLWPSPTSCACGDPTCYEQEFCTPAVDDTTTRQQH
eukprot:COSAG02_NODE_14778_length_1237_cov_1.250439_2_plen_281_part_01